MKKIIDDSSQINLGFGMTWVPQNDPPILLSSMGTDSQNLHLVALAKHLGKHAEKWKVAVVTSSDMSALVSTLAAHVPEVSTTPPDAAFDFLDGLVSTPVGARGPYVVLLDEGAGKALSEGAEESQRLDAHLRMGRSHGIHFVFVGYPHALARVPDLRY